MEGAEPKEGREMQNQIKEFYKNNWAAMKSYNARYLADKKSQEKRMIRKHKGLKGIIHIDI